MRELVRAAGLALLATVASPAAPAAATPCGGTVVLPTNVTVGPPDPPSSAHPLLTSGSASEGALITQLYQPLLWIDRQDRIDWSRSVAAAVAVDPAHRVFTVTLRPWHWSDGSPVTSADLVYTWHVIRALGATYVGFGIGGVPGLIASVSAPDPRTLVIRLTRAVNPDWFIQLGVSQFVPVPSRDWSRWTIKQQQTWQNRASFYRLVDGPFRLERFDVGRQAVLVANERYDGRHPGFRRYIASFQQGSDPLEALRTGQLDAALLPPAFRDVADRLTGYRRIAMGPQGSISTFVLNLGNPHRPFLADVRVRQAMARAIDQRRMIDTVFHGESEPQEGFVATSRTELLPPELRGGGGPMSFDSAAARALLDTAGYRPGPDGIRTRNGERLAFQLLITAGSEDGILMAEIAQADFRAVGIAMDIKEVEFNQLTARVLGPRDAWDATFFAWSAGGYPDGAQWFATGSSGNFAGYSDPTMDRLLADANTVAGTGPLFALERYVVEQQPMIFLPDGNVTVLARPGLDGVSELAGFGSEISVNRLRETGTCAGPRA